MKKSIKMVSAHLLCMALLGKTAVQPVHAEGSTNEDSVVFVRAGGAGAFGANLGVNRVVRSIGSTGAFPGEAPADGFIGARGHIDLSFTMAADEGYDVNHYSADVNPLNNKATMYIGAEIIKNPTLGGGSLECDSGIQFEPSTRNDVNGNLAPIGWGVFHYVGDYRFSPRVFDSSTPNGPGRAWRPAGLNPEGGTYHSPGRGAISGDMAFEGTPEGRARLRFSPLSTTVGAVTSDEIWTVRIANPNTPPTNIIPTALHPLAPWLDTTEADMVVLDTARLLTANVKHVTALTRSTPFRGQLDGSQVVGTWSAVQLRQHRAAGGNWRTWTANDVAQNRTGYDVNREGSLSVDRRYRGAATRFSRTIVQFSSDPAQNESLRSARIVAANNGRYSNETVTINLGMLTRPIGEKVE